MIDIDLDLLEYLYIYNFLYILILWYATNINMFYTCSKSLLLFTVFSNGSKLTTISIFGILCAFTSSR